eukprot:6307178-Alexandrium_andersonii.AAC.1
MSASLVGSEMCIRDRFDTCPSIKFRQCSTGVFLPGVVSNTVDLYLAAASVSYTHLTLPTICSV